MNLIRDIDFSDKAQAKSDIEKIKKLYFIHFTSKKVIYIVTKLPSPTTPKYINTVRRVKFCRTLDMQKALET